MLVSMRLCINSQRGIDALLELCPLRLKPFQHILVNAQGDGGFLQRHSPLRVGEKRIIQRRNIGSVNLFIRHAINALPIYV